MRRQWVFPVLAATFLVVAALVLSGRGHALSAAPSDRLEVTGIVRDDETTVRAPAIEYPAIDIGVGVRSRPRPAPQPTPPPKGPRMSGRVASLSVEVGSRVTTGQPLMLLDDAMLVMAARSAGARTRQARMDLRRIDELEDDLAAKRADLADARSQVLGAISEATAARARLAGEMSSIRRSLAAIPKVPPSFPGTIPMPPPGPPGFDPRTVSTQLRGALAKMTGLRTRLDAGLAQARTGLARLDEAGAKIDDAEEALRHARPVLRALVDVAKAEESVAAARTNDTVVHSPCSGRVLDVRAAGTVAMVGSPLVALRKEGPTRIDTYLTAGQLALLPAEARADVAADARPGATLGARLADVSDEYVYPPTEYPTLEVHSSAAFRVTFLLDGPETLPQGTWTEVSIHLKE